MISAIAARKAAQVALQSNDHQPSARENSSSQSSEPGEYPEDPGSKRKTPKQKISLQKKRRKRESKKRVQNVRYFAPQASGDAFRSQDNMIVVESEESSAEEEDDGEIVDEYNVPMVVESQTRKRKWSPSVVVADSAESDESASDPENADMTSLFPTSSLLAKQPKVEPAILSTFVPKIDHNIFVLAAAEIATLGLPISSTDVEGGTLVVLSPGEKICLLGTCTLMVLNNSICICGTTLPPSSRFHDIYAPRSAPLPVLEGLLGGTPVLNLPDKLRHLASNDVSVVLLRGLRTHVEGLGRICRTFEGFFEPSRWSRPSTLLSFSIDGLWMVTNRTKDLHEFAMSPSWTKALDDILISPDSNRLVYLVKGFKKTGKSTFSRILLNRLLSSYQRVAFLECDLGQSEFTPAGMVSLNVISSPLFGPPFTHLTTPISAHYIGSTTPRFSPSYYIEAIRALLQVYRLDVQVPLVPHIEDNCVADFIPLVVNTMGWIKGLGASLLQEIEDIVEPTEIFEFEAAVFPGGPADYDAMLSSSEDRYQDYVVRRHIVQPAPVSALSTNYSPADHRSLNILSYFHAVFPSNETIPGDLAQETVRQWNTSLSLCAFPPYEVDSAIAVDNVIFIGAGSEDVVPEEAAGVLNGALIALVRCEPGQLEDEVSEKQSQCSIPYQQMQPPPAPAVSSCVGLALVRGVSTVGPGEQHTETKALLHVLTPVPAPQILGARIFVKGEMELPVWGMLDFRTFGNAGDDEVAGVRMEHVPFLRWGKSAEGVVGAEKRRVRRNLMRRGQM